MGVGSRSYYAWKNDSKPAGGSKVGILEEKIKTIYFNKKQRYGSPRIAAELLDNGVKASRITVAKYMRKMGLRSKIGKKFKVTTDSKHSHKIMKNVLDRNFTPSEPSKVWVSDITYIHTKEGFLYLTGYTGDVDPSAGHTDPSKELFLSPTDDLTILLLFS